MNAHFNEIKKSLGTIKGRVEARNKEVEELKQRLDTLDANAAKRDSRVTASGPSGVEKFCRDLNLSGAEGAVQEQQLTPEEAGFDQAGGLISRLQPTLASSDRIVVPTYSAIGAASITAEGGAMTERDVTISGRTASTISIEYVTNYSQISMQLAQQSPEVVNLVTQEVSESINRKIESELVADTSGWANLDSLPEAAGSSQVMASTDPATVTIADLVAAVNKLPSYANPAQAVIVCNQQTLYALQLDLDSAGKPTMSSDYTASAARGLWSPSLLGMPVVTSGFMTGAGDSAAASKTVAMVIDPNAIKAFRTNLSLRSSNIPSFSTNVLSIGALQGWASKVVDSSRVIKLVTAAS